jgi:hypothetical protein
MSPIPNKGFELSDMGIYFFIVNHKQFVHGHGQKSHFLITGYFAQNIPFLSRLQAKSFGANYASASFKI